MTTPDFAAAQQRILARRAATASRPPASTTSPSSGPQIPPSFLARLPPSLRAFTTSSLSLFATLQSPYGTRPAFRVGQLDAELLDEELLSLLKGQVSEALKYLGTHLSDDWSLEISAGLRGVLWWLSIWGKGVSYGGSLQGLRYVDARKGSGGLLGRMTGWSRRRTLGGSGSEAADVMDPSRVQKMLYGLLTVGGRYGWEKWEDWLVEQEGGYETTPLVERLSRITRSLTTTHEAAALMSFLVFLYNGRYRTLVDRVLGFRLVPTSGQTSREVSFEYLNRQLVWHAFTEFLLFILPLVGISRWRRWLAKAWKKAKAMVMRKSEDDDDMVSQGELGFLPERTCAICYKDQNPTTGASEADIIAASTGGGGVIGSAQTDVTNPYEAIPCGCVYCFVCLAHKLEGEDGQGWTCLRCGELVKECKPWSGDVIEETTTPSSSGSKGSRKSVVFVEDPDNDAEEGNDTEGEPEHMLSSVEPMPFDDETSPQEGVSDQDTIDEAGMDGGSAQWVTYDDAGNDADEGTVSEDDEG